jgi:hypothetical protein
MYALTIFLALSAPPQAPPPPQAPFLALVAERPAQAPVPSCPCSSACSCGCQEGLPCDCVVSSRIQVAGSFECRDGSCCRPSMPALAPSLNFAPRYAPSPPFGAMAPMYAGPVFATYPSFAPGPLWRPVRPPQIAGPAWQPLAAPMPVLGPFLGPVRGCPTCPGGRCGR